MTFMKLENKLLCLSLLAFCMQTEAFATDVITLNDGSVIEGDIIVQHPGKDLIVRSKKATIVAINDEIDVIIDHRFSLSELPKEWKVWLNQDENKSLFPNDKDYFTLCDVSFKDRPLENNDKYISNQDVDKHTSAFKYNQSVYQNVRVLEQGYKVKFLSLSELELTILPSEILRISKERCIELDSLNVFDLLETNQDEYIGQIIEQEYGKSITINDTVKGLYVVRQEDVIVQKKVKNSNDKAYIAELSDYTDIIITNSNDEIKGVITKIVFPKDDEPGYMVIQDNQGDPLSVKYTDVREMRREIKKKSSNSTSELSMVNHNYIESEVKNGLPITIHYKDVNPANCKMDDNSLRITKKNYGNTGVKTTILIDNIKNGVCVDIPKGKGNFVFYRLTQNFLKKDKNDFIYSTERLSFYSKEEKGDVEQYVYKVKRGKYALVRDGYHAYFVVIQ